MDLKKDSINCLKCHHRHPQNGNCTVVGGFCTSVPAAYCPLITELLARAEAAEQKAENAEIKLAAYEQTGLEPEAVLSATDMAKIACALHELNKYKKMLGTDYDLDRLWEIVDADRDGRCVVLPFAPGTTIYEADGEHGVVKHSLEDSAHFVINSNAVADDGSVWHDYWTDYDVDNAHKTREEAEAALEEMKDGR